MDPLPTALTAVGLALAVAGTIALIAWRHRRSRARVPAVLLGLAVAVLAAPPLVEVAGEAIYPVAEGAAEPEDHPEDAVVPAEELKRR